MHRPHRVVAGDGTDVAAAAPAAVTMFHTCGRFGLFPAKTNSSPLLPTAMAAVKAQAQAELVAGKAALKAKQYDEAIEKLANALQIMCVAARGLFRLGSRAERTFRLSPLQVFCTHPPLTVDQFVHIIPGLRPASTRPCSSTWRHSTSSMATPC